MKLGEAVLGPFRQFPSASAWTFSVLLQGEDLGHQCHPPHSGDRPGPLAPSRTPAAPFGPQEEAICFCWVSERLPLGLRCPQAVSSPGSSSPTHTWRTAYPSDPKVWGVNIRNIQIHGEFL